MATVSDHTRSQDALNELRAELAEVKLDRDRWAAMVSSPSAPDADAAVADARLRAVAQLSRSGASGAPSSGLKLRPPNIAGFSGEREKALDWMLTVDRRLAVTGESDTLGGLEFATGHLEGFAATWWRFFTASHPEVTGWLALRPHFDQAFKLVGEEELYEKRLLGIKQHGSVDSYVDEFLKCAVRLPSLSDAFKQRRFRQGICSRLRNDFAIRKFDSLDDMVREALNLTTILDAHLLMPDADPDVPVVAAIPAQRTGLAPQGPVTCFHCGEKGHKRPQCQALARERRGQRFAAKSRPSGQNARPKGSMPMGRYNGGGRVHNIEAVDPVEDSDDELRQGNDLA